MEIGLRVVQSVLLTRQGVRWRLTVLSANGFVRLPIAYLTLFGAVFDSTTSRTEF